MPGTRLLEGVVVVEMAQVITGPMAGMLLADLGARVLKVEDPARGDSFRRWNGNGDSSVNAAFAAFNRGKESVAIDTKSTEGQETYRRLVQEADVVIENFRPGVLDRAGIGYEHLGRANPRLVYCHISGMGTTGPRSAMPTYDGVAQALSGLWSQLTDLTRPEAVGPAFADQLTAMYAVLAVLAALQRREASGGGSKLEVDMLSSCLSFQTLAVTSFLMDGAGTDRTTRARGSLCYGFVGSDSRPFCVHLSSPEKFWDALCRVLDDPAIKDDPMFTTKRDRSVHFEELGARLQKAFARKPRDYWLRRLDDEGVPGGPINSISEALTDPQVAAIGSLGPHGPLAPVVVDGTRCGAEAPAPELGAHTERVLGELAEGRLT